MYSEKLQYFFDLMIISIFFFIWFPLFILFSILLFLFQKKIIYKQPRYGKNFKIFYIYKFMTIVPGSDNIKISFFNRFLRRSSLDELPQFFNILKKDMSLVGPRPIIIDPNLNLSDEKMILKHSVLPGITGYSQIKSMGTKRELIDKINLDFEYVNKLSFLLYFTILFKTLFVIKKRYINNPKGKSL